MLIALFFTYNYSLKTWSDSGILFKELEIYEMLNKKYGVRFKFITYGYKEEKDYLEQYDFIEVIPIYEFISCSKSKIINYLKSFLIPFKIKNLLIDVSLIKQHQLLGSWVAIGSKLINKKPLIIRTGYDMFLFSKYEKKSFFIKSLYYFLTYLSLKVANLYTVSSNTDSKKLQKFFKGSNVEIRRNWIKEIRDIKSFEERYDSKVLSVGRLEKQKNYSHLIASLSETKFSLDIVGSGSLGEELKSEAREKGVELNYLQPMENESLLDVYQNYKYFVLPSLYEGNPKSLIEAMSSGCVVIVSNIENNKEIVAHEHNGFLMEKDISSLASIISYVEKNPKISTYITENGLSFINKNYLLSNLVEKEYEDYEKLAFNI